MGGSKGVFAILLGVMVIAMISGCAPADEPQFSEGEAIAIVVDSLPDYSEKDSLNGLDCKTVQWLSEKYIGNGTWEVSLNVERSVWGSWKVYENSQKVLPDGGAQNRCY